MKVLAVLQNQWFNDPDRVRATLARYPEARRRMIHFALFAGCKTGRILKAVFGARCNEIVWEEASPKIGGQASSVFPADRAHLQAVLADVKPDVVLGFGRIACDGLAGLVPDARLIIGPHPTARNSEVFAQLKNVAARLEVILQTSEMSLVKRNALADPTYCPYCMRCSGPMSVRMTKVAHLLWKHHCGAVHDEREKVKA